MEELRRKMDQSNKEIGELLRRSAKTTAEVTALIKELAPHSNFFNSDNSSSSSPPITTGPTQKK